MRQPLAARPLRGVVAGALAALAMIPVAALLAGEQPAAQTHNSTGSPAASQRSGGEWARLTDAPEWAKSFDGLRHFTQPSRDAIMGFSFPTQVQEVKVKGGDRIKAGDLLVRGWDNEAVASVAQQESRAKNDTDVQKATSQRDLAQIEFDAQNKIKDAGAGNEQEWKRAKYTLQLSNIAIDAAQQALVDQQLAVDRLKADLDRYRLIAPFDGVVESVKLDVGAAVADSQPVLRVVNTDKLWIAVPTPTDMVMSLGLKPGDPAWALMATPDDPVVLAGKVIEVSPVAEFASQRTIVKVEVDNPRGRPAGLEVWVRFTEPTGEWRERIWKGEGASAALGNPAREGRDTQGLSGDVR